MARKSAANAEGENVAPVFYDLSDLRRLRITFHRTTLWTMAREGRFPKPRKLGTGKFGRRVWVAREVDQWIADRIGAGEAA